MEFEEANEILRIWHYGGEVANDKLLEAVHKFNRHKRAICQYCTRRNYPCEGQSPLTVDCDFFKEKDINGV